MTTPAEFANHGQASQVYALFDTPPVVFACRVNQVFTTHDKVFEFLYDSITTGAYTDILPGMTILLGSAAGSSDRGITYARKAPTASKIYTGETSEIAWADNLYVTVLAEFGIWNEYPLVLKDTTVLMKHDVLYMDQHTNLDPIPVIGSDRVAKLSGASVTLSFDGSGSYVPGSTISSYLWTCAGATITNGSTATPSVEITAAGRYLLKCVVTAANGKSRSTYRTVHIWDEAHPPANVIAGSLSGSYERGGWEFALSVLDPASAIRERTKVILFAEDWYGATKSSFGPLAGSENILAIGWMENEDVVIDAQGGAFQVALKGTQYWLNQEHDFVSIGIEAVSGTPIAWTQMQSLTVDKVLWHFLLWRTTLANCIDIKLTGDTRQALELSCQPGSIWEQVKALAWQSILAMPCCDRYGRLFIKTETVLLPSSDRSLIPTASDINADDCEAIQAEKTTVTTVSQIILSGVTVTGMVGQALFSLSRGHIPLRYGNPTVMERLLLGSQAQANELAGNLLEKENCPLKFSFQNLLANNRMVDICPNQYVAATINAADNPRGIAYSGNVLVKNISMNFEDGAWAISWEAQAETQAQLTTNGDIPSSEIVNGEVVTTDTWPPSIPPKLPPTPPIPPVITTTPPAGDCGEYAPANSFGLSWSKSVISGADPDRIAQALFPCKLRAAPQFNGPSVLVIGIRYEGSARTRVHVYGISGGSRVIEGTVTPPPEGDDWTATSVLFAPVSALNVDGFELELEAGGDDPDASTGSAITLNWFTQDAIINTGSYTATWNVVQLNPNLIRGDYIITIHDISGLFLDQVNLKANISTGSPSIYIKAYHQFGGSAEMYWSGPYAAGGWRQESGSYQLTDPSFWGGGPGTMVISFADRPEAAVSTFVASGTIWYSTITVTPSVRKITLGSSRIYNVCGQSA